MKKTILFSNGLKRWTSRKEFPAFTALFLLCMFLTIKSPVFMTVENIMNVLRQFSTIGILAVGGTMILITGGIDLSLGSGIGLLGVIMAIFTSLGLHPVLVFLLTIVSGILLYSINGLLITRVHINAFIATLGTQSIFRGITLLLSQGMPVKMLDTSLQRMGKGYLFGIVPVPVIFMLVIALIGHFFLLYTTSGRNIFAVGNSQKAATYSGIRTQNVILMTYMVMGALCAVSGMLTTATLAAAEPLAGQGRELDVIAAAVIGGASLTGGEGSIAGAMIGAALMGVLKNAFILLSVPGYWQTVTVGVVIILAVALDGFRSQKRD